jgi:hypothetical protein
LLTLYDLISLIVEEFESHFTDETLIEELVKCVMKKWYETQESEMRTIIPVFGILNINLRYSFRVNKSL